jgi:N-acetylglucosamine-6-phosphate deacetylase
MGAIDIHFHGAFGIDLMKAQTPELNEISHRLGEAGVAGFCPTTLSVDVNELAQSVERLGHWIQRTRKQATFPSSSAVPLGIHLEGPFINSICCGAHPPELIRKFDFNELDSLWELSQHTLKILTIAPETLTQEQCKQLCLWARKRQISLSIGHSRASEVQAQSAFQQGFRGITHAWNALPFHQRAPGPLGAAFQQKDSYIELIIDQIHVAPSVISWTEELQPAHRLCYVSDCVPAAGLGPGISTSFGPLKIEYAQGACRLSNANGALAGGGKILTQAFAEWILASSGNAQKTLNQLKTRLKRRLPSITEAPILALKLSKNELSRVKRRRTQWILTSHGTLQATPLK